ncbi:NAD-dependent epimerase/dehydratase family protein [Sphingomonas profundi]|uniref:NAD-dependent epimerase/dehydratase family protein n=1 Tax=Alterirhizorhabdus profundi TaxID=2681549 RepID=UPI0012E8BCFE|nr:NAD(P)-dependent oxidoreductase [Sphingomonas profundi]
MATASGEFPYAKVLVTGGAGFIGSRVVPRLEALGVRQVVVDNLYVNLPLPDARDGVVPIEADIRDGAAMRAIIAEHKPEAILHLAAVHHIPTCEREPHLAFDVNVMGTQTLLDAASEGGIRDIVFTSSGAVYQWKDGPLTEAATPIGATDVYSITKLSGEYQVAGWAGRTGGRAHIGRLFNTIGTGDPNGHLIPDLLSQLTAGEGPVTVKLGNTKPKRDYIHTDDVADAFVALLAGLKRGPDVDYFNICTGKELSVAELVQLMGDLLRVDVTIESDPTRFRKIDRLQQLGAPEKILAERGWQAQIPVRQALARIIRDLGHTVHEDDVLKAA